MTHVAYIGLGANLGERKANILAAADLLRRVPGVGDVTLSSLYETEPVGGPAGQGPYLNAAARVETDLSPGALLAVLQDIEARLGRQRAEKWGPRTIDLDLLLFDQEVTATPELTIPHPLMHERRFVLEPLAEIAPDVIYPLRNMTIRQLLERLPGHRRQ